MNKKELLQDAIDQGNEYESISWDGILDLCDENMKLVRWLIKQLEKLSSKGEINFELDF
jgi:hypothetical protein